MTRWIPKLLRLDAYGPEDRLHLRPLLIECLGEGDYDGLFAAATPAFVVPWAARRRGYAAHAALHGRAIVGLCVDPDLRRLGLGSLVLNACLVELGLTGGEAQVVLAPGSDGRAFLASNGFKHRT